MTQPNEPLDPRERQAVEAKALALLTRREHSVHELDSKLRRSRGANEAVIRAVVADLAARELVSDARYAAAYARDAIRLKPRARRRLVGELVASGVPAVTAATAVDAAFADLGVDDAALARRLGEAYLPRIADADPAARWRRLGGYLERRGFDAERIYSVCEALLPDRGESG